ncbi:MAG: type III pantothenate kinase [Planctomycetaceae bacterium]|nr:type III pantothenate kinase [Planctomycetaceae bacterium]
MPLILAVDAGNTRVKFGVFESHAAKVPQVLAVSAVRLDDDTGGSQGNDSPASRMAARLASWLDELDLVPDRQVVSGSNPPVRDQLLSDWPLAVDSVRLIDHYRQLPVALDVEQPETVGIDRLLTSLAARRLCGAGQPIVVVDAGTATTVNLTTSDGVFRGGAILPGLRLSAHAMHDYTARLPLINADQLFPAREDRPDAPLPGRSTVDAMKAGLFWGQVGAVRTIADQLLHSATDSYGDERPGIVVMTGGGGRQIVSQMRGAIYVDCLTLHGLAALADDDQPC